MPFFARDQWSNIDSIVRFVVPVLVNFTAMKYQGTPDSPFEARPITIFLSIFTLLLYCCLSLPLVVRLPAFGTACGARTFLFLRILSLSLPVALLASLLFRGLSFFLLCLPMLILLLPAHLWSLMQNLKQRILVVAFVRLFRRRGIALLPRTVANTHFIETRLRSLPWVVPARLVSLRFKILRFGSRSVLLHFERSWLCGL